ncbi:MAG TPA: hypothetical protein VFY13_01135, partial [Luteolibacter sp.]|nr:hypothetical protein [Luteolibacter sp.]
LFGAADPMADATALQPTSDSASDANYLIFTYRRSDAAFNAGNATIAAQYGSTITSWTNAVHDGTNIIITPANDFYGVGVDKVEVKIKKTLAASGKLFARVSLTVSP